MRFKARYDDSAVNKITFDGYTVKGSKSDGTAFGFLEFWDENNDYSTWQPLQFHFHSPSEHQLNGTLKDLELHIVHQRVGGSDYLVVGFVFDKSYNEDNAFLTALNMPNWGTGNVNFLPITEMLSSMDPNFYHYQGSLTTPPCTEAVTWVVMM